MSKVFIKIKNEVISIKIYTNKEIKKYIKSKDFKDDLDFMEAIIKGDKK